MVKMTLAEIFSRSLLTSRVEFARKEDNLEEGLEKFYAISSNDPEMKNVIELNTINTATGETKVEHKSLGEFIQRYGMQSRWYLI
ncbi:hypothetical protein PR1_111 [Providencia phage vB_PreS_PR1]|uniref:Uncharacterized protein n=1 Tax=Providencia phage vB_PreS_PR1 TaxID=1931407 RepID=A0A1S6KV67_9CAUD|nr:hypothetical protein FDH30_gp103 [Providencia phage vB_PreS_PR1]AQT25333.1 hypothetical protein PR1_111 [Providencia phage vB_PreS_PR1]